MFSLQQECGSARMGCLATLKGIVHTPSMLLMVRNGDVHGLTPDNLTRFQSEFPGLIVNPFDYASKGVIDNLSSGKKVTDFFGLQSHLVVCVPKDGLKSEYLEGNNDKGVSVMLRSGRLQVTPEYYTGLMNRLGADFFAAMWDEVKSDAKEARLKGSVFRTWKWFDKISKLAGGNSFGGIWESVIGGDSREMRKLASSGWKLRSSELESSGFVICGFDQRTANFEGLLKETISGLPIDKPRLLIGNISPDKMVEAVKVGVDLFDSSFVWDLSSKGQAIVFGGAAGKMHYNVLDLNDSEFKGDGRSIEEGCECCACSHSRGYVHHLLSEGEILGSVLLQVHNLTAMAELVSQIRSYIKCNELQDFSLSSLCVLSP